MISLTDSTFYEFTLQNYSMPILVMFTSSRCGPCKAMYPLIESLKNEIPVIFTKVNTDENPNLLRFFGIQSVPTLLLVDKGMPLRKIGFLSTKQEVINFIQG